MKIKLLLEFFVTSLFIVPLNAAVSAGNFKPTPHVPSLQCIGNVEDGGAADIAGLKQGDFIIEVKKKLLKTKKSVIPPGIEPGTLSVLDSRDNHYTTESLTCGRCSQHTIDWSFSPHRWMVITPPIPLTKRWLPS